MILDPSLLPFADKTIIVVLIVGVLWLAGIQRVSTFPVAPPAPVPPAPVPVPPAPVPQPPAPAAPVPPVIPPVVPAPAPAPVPVGSDFDRCVAITLREEGGNDDDPSDTGGRTSRGITAEDWAAWRRTHSGLDSDVWKAPQSQILAIYKEQYWNPLYCDSLPSGVDLVVFDHGVLAGIGTSAKLLQTIVGTDVDGEIGPLTIAAAAALDPVSLVGRFCDGRQAYYDSLQNAKYIKGWTDRVVAVHKDALALAAEAPRPKAIVGAVPPWLTLARSLVGTHAADDNAVILSWPNAIAAKFPDMADYCARYVHDSTPWCGLTVAYVLSQAGIRPVFGPTDTDKFLWADAWRQFGTAVDTPQPGDVLVFKWAGGGEHVTIFDHTVETDDYYHCCGGNQGNGHVVSIEAMPMSNCIAIRRPA